MGDKSGIEWTDATWNPVTGCSHVSDGCRFCYAETLTRRFSGEWDVPDLPWTAGNAEANVILHPERLEQPSRWRRPRTIFVNSMSDLFHERVPFEFIDRVFAAMLANPRHVFQVLTKRPERMCDYLSQPELAGCSLIGANLPGHLWLGVSIESRRHVDRADVLRDMPMGAAHRFISAEPLLGPLVPLARIGGDREAAGWPEAVWEAGYTGPGIDCSGIEWLIAGGESGQHFGERPDRFLVERWTELEGGRRRTYYRPKPEVREWMRDLRDACERAGTAFMLKQWGGPRPKSGGRTLDGVVHDWTPPRAGATLTA